MKKYWAHFSKVLILVLTLSLAGCAGQTKQTQGTAVGAGVGAGLGAIVGQAVGGSTEATLLGAGIGAALGGVAGNQIGRYMDAQEQALRQAVAASDAASIRREQDVLRATFKSEAFFDYDSATVKAGGITELSRVATVLNSYPQTHIQVAGHTDSRGAAEYNQRLSERRAAAVKKILVQQGVDGRRIATVGFGESQPISSDHAQNRRVEVIIIPDANAVAQY